MKRSSLLAPVVVGLALTIPLASVAEQDASAEVDPEGNDASVMPSGSNREKPSGAGALPYPEAKARADVAGAPKRAATASSEGGIPKRGAGSAKIACAPECLIAYGAAFDLLIDDRPAEAAIKLRETIPTIDEPGFRSSATALLELAEARDARLRSMPTGLLGTPEGDGRLAMIGWTTLASAGAGTLAGAMLDLPDPRSNILMLMAFTGTGLAASVLATSEATIMPGTATLYGTGIMAGGLTAWNMSGMLGLSPQLAAGSILLGGVAGGALGLWSGSGTEISRGRASMVAYSTAWGTTIGALLQPVIQPEENLTRHGLLAAGTLIGLAGGAFAAAKTDMSRSRLLLVNAGALMGGLALGGLGIAVLDDQPAAILPRVVPAMSALGVIGGGGLGLLLTRGMDEKGAPSEGLPYAGALLDIREGEVRPGLPKPFVVRSSSEDGKGGLGLVLLSGEI